MEEADVRVITGDQGAGKTTVGTALAVDDCCENITGITSPTGIRYEAQALTGDEQKKLITMGVKYNPHRHIRVFSLDGKQSKIITRPKDYIIESKVRLFSNYTLYGVRFMKVDIQTIVENINNPLVWNGWILLDESIMTDKRDTMAGEGKMMAWFGAQSRRRRLHMVILAQYSSMVQGRFIQYGKTKVLCTYDKYSRVVTIDVNKNSEVMTPTSFYAPEYWTYFDHEEIVKVPQYKIDRVLEKMNQ